MIMDNKLLIIILVFIGAVFIVISGIYFITPAKSLPNFFPGFDPMITKTHFKHGIGALFLGLGVLAFAWFKSGKKSLKKEE
jgi:hypothetical protein